MEHFAEKDVFTYIATRKSKTASEAKTTNNLNLTERDLGTSLADQPGLDQEPKNLKSLGSIANQHGGWSILVAVLSFPSNYASFLQDLR